MPHQQLVYLVFGCVLVIALFFDLGLLSKKEKNMTITAALWQTLLWVSLAMGFFAFLWVEESRKTAIEYLSAYLMEWSLSIDNVFVFVLIFSAFQIKPQYYPRVLLVGVLMAIVFRIMFITIGVQLVEQFHWILYIFGIFLVYTGMHMFKENDTKEFDPQQNKVYRFLNRFLPITHSDGEGKYVIWKNGKPRYTILFVVVIILATVDIVFALDSIPAVMGISRERLVIYTSNIFAVLGLRSLFFLLKGAVNKFQYLQQGIAIVLVVIGLKMLGEHFIDQWFSKNVQVIGSLALIVICIGGSMLLSTINTQKQAS
ncbi:MAG: TerC/Alx family metal homeostasis membrane protein [Sphingobacteriia bacterium]|nr:TerC/Alx family metal homeostasis membrane protein [Sphingobacteriia bacterium]